MFIKVFVSSSFKQVDINRNQMSGYSFSDTEIINEVTTRIKERYCIILERVISYLHIQLINPNYIEPPKEESPTESPPIQAAPKKGFFDFLKRK
jgi:hypothetical protein